MQHLLPEVAVAREHREAQRSLRVAEALRKSVAVADRAAAGPLGRKPAPKHKGLHHHRGEARRIARPFSRHRRVRRRPHAATGRGRCHDQPSLRWLHAQISRHLRQFHRRRRSSSIGRHGARRHRWGHRGDFQRSRDAALRSEPPKRTIASGRRSRALEPTARPPSRPIFFRSANLTDDGTKGAPSTSRLGYIAATDQVLAYFGHTQMYIMADSMVRHQGGYLAVVDSAGKDVARRMVRQPQPRSRVIIDGTKALVLGLGDAYPKGIIYSTASTGANPAPTPSTRSRPTVWDPPMASSAGFKTAETRT